MSVISRRSILTAGAAALTSMMAGCAKTTSNDGRDIAASPDTGPSGVDPAALEAWRDFPVTRVPRPIVLLQEPLRQSGYHTGDAKLAAMMGRYELATQLPSTHPATTTVTLPDGTFRLRLIAAPQAYQRVRDTGSPSAAPDADPAPLRITKIELGSAQYGTDRGQRKLPAWLFHVPGSFEPLAWPALHPDEFWRFGDLRLGGDVSDGRLAADGRTLTVTMPGPRPDACPGDPVYRYDPVVVERSTAVGVGVRAQVVSIAPGQRRDDCGYDSAMRAQQYTVVLAAPLGNRVLVGSSGVPAPVTTSR